MKFFVVEAVGLANKNFDSHISACEAELSEARKQDQIVVGFRWNFERQRPGL